MKKLSLALICISLLLTLVISTTAKAKPTKPTYLTKEDKLYQFQRPGRAWTKKGPDKFNDYHFVRRDGSTIYIGSRDIHERTRILRFIYYSTLVDSGYAEKIQVDERENH